MSYYLATHQDSGRELFSHRDDALEWVERQADYHRQETGKWITHGEEESLRLADGKTYVGTVRFMTVDERAEHRRYEAEQRREAAEAPEEQLADAKARLNIPTIVVICGSTRFMTAMTDADRELTAAGHIVVKPGCNMKQPHSLWATEELAEPLKVRLDDLHRAKIRIADEVLVVGDYVGESTRAEIAYARELGKPIRFTHPEVDPATAGA